MKENLHLDEKDPLETPITELGLSNRILKRLAQNDIKVLRHLLLLDSSEISEIRGMGASSINEIDELKKLLNEGYGISDLEVKQRLAPEDIKITKIGLPIRTSSILMENNINTLHDLLERDFESLVKIAGIGSNSLKLINKVKVDHGKGFNIGDSTDVEPRVPLAILTTPLSLLDIQNDILEYLADKSIFTIKDFLSFKPVLFQSGMNLSPVKRAINTFCFRFVGVNCWDDLKLVVQFVPGINLRLISSEFPSLDLLINMRRTDYINYLLCNPRHNPTNIIFDFFNCTGMSFKRDVSSGCEAVVENLNKLMMGNFSLTSINKMPIYKFEDLCRRISKFSRKIDETTSNASH